MEEEEEEEDEEKCFESGQLFQERMRKRKRERERESIQRNEHTGTEKIKKVIKNE